MGNDRQADDLIDRYTALIAEGEREYTNALTPEEIEITLRSMRNLAVKKSSPDAAARDFARRLPKLTSKLQSLSTLALVALAERSEQGQAIERQISTLAIITS